MMDDFTPTPAPTPAAPSSAGSGPRRRTAAMVGGGLAAGLLAGGVLMGALSASADTNTTTDDNAGSGSPSSSATAPGANQAPRDESQPQRPDETLLTGDTAEKVKAAALAKYPGATVLRIETDSDGVYEAHLTKADGTRVTVEVDKSFAVTGDEAPGPGGPGGPGGHGGPRGGGAPSASPTGTTSDTSA
jgi:hypothetical protein